MQTRSDIFIGRDSELSQFRTILQATPLLNILNIHTYGEGGVGKTQLLLKMMKLCREEFSDGVICPEQLIDFYDSKSRTKSGIMQQLVALLGKEHFPGFEMRFSAYHAQSADTDREALLSQLEDTFASGYKSLAERASEEGKVLPLFFDTYEFIQGEEYLKNGQKHARATDFSRWLETKFFEYISINTCVVISGRYQLVDITSERLSLKEWKLGTLNLTEAKAFWKECFKIEHDDKLISQFGSEELIEIFWNLAGGLPILLALIADWISYPENPLSPRQFLQEITGQKTLSVKTLTDVQREIFEKALVDRIGKLHEPEDTVVTTLAVGYRRMTSEMLSSVTDIPVGTCRAILFDKLAPLSFIKRKEGDVVLLQDEMRRLVVQHYWNWQDKEWTSRRNIAGRLVAYYRKFFLRQKGLLESDREIYSAELLDYWLLAAPEKGLAFFREEFDFALDDGRYEYCRVLLREAERFEHDHPNYLPFPDRLHIRLRRIRYERTTDQSTEDILNVARKTIKRYEGKADWDDNVLSGHFELERGSIAFSLELFPEANRSFLKAKEIFFDLGDSFRQYSAANWLGYTLYRQGKFDEAENALLQSLDGFYRTFTSYSEGRKPPRQLIRGIHLAIGNLAIVYGFSGRYDLAISNAEIALSITRSLKNYDIEITRALYTSGKIALMTNDRVNAYRYFDDAQKLLKESHNRGIKGRIKPHLAYLEHRFNEFAYLLEYYRAEEIEALLKEQQKTLLPKLISQSKKTVLEAINELKQEPPIKKELTDAYYVLGELCMIEPVPGHWRDAEMYLREALKWAKACQFHYGVVDSLESLVTNYYFWNGSETVSQEQRERNERESDVYRAELDKQEIFYFDLYGKYYITSGDEQFDRALNLFKANRRDKAIEVLCQAFKHYVSAVQCMKKFNEDLHYLALRVFYNRFRKLGEFERDEPAFSIEPQHWDTLRSVWNDMPMLDEIFTYAHCRFQERSCILYEIAPLSARIQEELHAGHIGFVSILNVCLIRLYRELSPPKDENDEFQEPFLLCLNEQASYFRSLSDEFQAQRTVGIVRDELPGIQDPILRQAIEGYADCREGTLLYRRSEYGRLLETFLQDDLGIGKTRFDKLFTGDRAEALRILKDGERKLCDSIDTWEEALERQSGGEEKAALRKFIVRYSKNLGELYFRLGELLMLDGCFEDSETEGSVERGALHYLKNAIEKARSVEDWYRYDDAVQSYINALYFAGKYDDPGYKEKRQSYEQELEKNSRHSSIMGRFRIMQGDVLFSDYFKQVIEEEDRYHYILKGEPKTRVLRRMWRYYAEACNFMAQHSSKNFSAAVRVLQRRIQLIAVPSALQEIQSSLQDVWNEQEYLRDKRDELNALVRFANIRSILLSND